MQSYYKGLIKEHGVNLVNTIAIVAVHVTALAMFFVFSWSGLLLATSLYVITGLGITVGYHRLLTHNGFQTFKWVRWLAAFIGGQAWQGPCFKWVTTHRVHHKESDGPGDPHSPLHGPWWAHMLWLAAPEKKESLEADFAKFIPDLLKDKVLVWLNRSYAWQLTVVLLAVLLAGYFYGGVHYAFSWFILAGPVRIVFVWHVTWIINSICHMWGYRNYQTRDNSTNNWLAAMLGFGEGWHNNHHGTPTAVNHGQRWWEFDVSYRVIWLMKKVGLAWDLTIANPKKIMG